MLACNFICLRFLKWMGRRGFVTVRGQPTVTRPPLVGYGFTWGTRCPTHTRTPTEPVDLPRGFPYPCQCLYVPYSCPSLIPYPHLLVLFRVPSPSSIFRSSVLSIFPCVRQPSRTFLTQGFKWLSRAVIKY